MPRAILLSYTGVADPSREAEFVRWYDEIHIPEVCSVPGFVSGRRFLASEAQRSTLVGPLPRNLAVYELDTDDLAGTVSALEARVKSGEISQPQEGLLAPNATHEVGVFEVQSVWPERPVQHNE
jgi:hypothetical protein